MATFGQRLHRRFPARGGSRGVRDGGSPRLGGPSRARAPDTRVDAAVHAAAPCQIAVRADPNDETGARVDGQAGRVGAVVLPAAAMAGQAPRPPRDGRCCDDRRVWLRQYAGAAAAVARGCGSGRCAHRRGRSASTIARSARRRCAGRWGRSAPCCSISSGRGAGRVRCRRCARVPDAEPVQAPAASRGLLSAR